eukprot:1043836_1
MLPSISISSLVLFVSHAALTCNRIEMTGFPFPFATFATFPEHLCMTTVQNPNYDISNARQRRFIESSKVICDGPGQTTGITNFYDNMDCSGTPTRTETLSEALTCFTGGDACAYTAIETWQGVTQCNGDQVAPDAFTNYTSTGSVFESGLCVNETYSEWSSMMVCVPNTSVTLQFWLSEGCVGAPVLSEIVAKQGCNETSSSAATVNCNAVAPNPSTAPTQQTFEPTEDPTQEPTIATAEPTTGARTTGDPTTGTFESRDETKGPSESPITGPSGEASEKEESWFIVAIVFIVLFVIAMILIVYFGFLVRGKKKEINDTSKYKYKTAPNSEIEAGALKTTVADYSD